jgi:hypothetical protein
MALRNHARSLHVWFKTDAGHFLPDCRNAGLVEKLMRAKIVFTATVCGFWDEKDRKFPAKPGWSLKD